jgi:hypothetical protein
MSTEEFRAVNEGEGCRMSVSMNCARKCSRSLNIV